jgi:hypothetical protein
MNHNAGVEVYQLVQCDLFQNLHTITPQRHPKIGLSP